MFYVKKPDSIVIACFGMQLRMEFCLPGGVLRTQAAIGSADARVPRLCSALCVNRHHHVAATLEFVRHSSNGSLPSGFLDVFHNRHGTTKWYLSFLKKDSICI